MLLPVACCLMFGPCALLFVGGYCVLLLWCVVYCVCYVLWIVGAAWCCSCLHVVAASVVVCCCAMIVVVADCCL